jgi:hypothetical protein
MTEATGGELTVVVDVDYWQFYLKDAASPWASEDFDDPDFADHLGVRDGLVYVGSGRHFGDVTVRVSVLDQQPGSPPDRWQHAAEASLMSSGVLEVYGWSDNGPLASVPVPAGSVRLRLGWEGVVPFRYADELLDLPSTEQVTIQVWSAPVADKAVLRRHAWADPSQAT